MQCRFLVCCVCLVAAVSGYITLGGRDLVWRNDGHAVVFASLHKTDVQQTSLTRSDVHRIQVQCMFPNGSVAVAEYVKDWEETALYFVDCGIEDRHVTHRGEPFMAACYRFDPTLYPPHLLEQTFTPNTVGCSSRPRTSDMVVKPAESSCNSTSWDYAMATVITIALVAAIVREWRRCKTARTCPYPVHGQ